jgi:CheY-like chemotaxis protein/HEAT repeat protein
MQAPKAHIFWNAPFGQRHLTLWLKTFGYQVFPEKNPYVPHMGPDDVLFLGPDVPVPEAISSHPLRIGLGRPLDGSPFCLKMPTAPRVLAHLLKNLHTPERITDYTPGIPADFIDIIPWLGTLDASNSDVHIPELFQYIDDPKADTAILPVLTDRIQALLRSIPELILLGLEQGGGRTRTLCARMAGTLAEEEALPLLLSLLHVSEHADETEALIRALGAFSHPEARKQLHREIQGQDTLRSLAAIESLAQKADTRDIALLSRLISHPETLIAVDAAGALAAIGSPDAYTALASHLHPEDALVRKVVATLLAQAGEKALLPLMAAMRRANDQERIIGALVLGHMGLPQALDCLCEQLRHPNASVRFSACEALGRIPSEKTFFPLSAALEDPNQDVVCAAITGLNHQHPQSGIQAVRQSMTVNPQAHSTLVAAIAAMQATHLFLGLSQDRKLARDIVQAAAQSQNRRLLHRFLEASAHISDPGTRQGCEALLRQAIREIPPDRPRILVVDDSPTMRRFYETLLPQYGYAVETARDGLDALNRLRPDPTRFSLVLTDLNMPNKNGIELTRALREEMGTPLPILMVSTETLENQEKSARNAGINAFLRKPFTAKDLAHNLASLLP